MALPPYQPSNKSDLGVPFIPEKRWVKSLQCALRTLKPRWIPKGIRVRTQAKGLTRNLELGRA